MPSFALRIVLFFLYLVSSFFSATCCDLMSIVQVAFVNPLINELFMYVSQATATLEVDDD